MVAQWVKRPIAYSAGIRFSGEFTSVLAVKIWVEFDLSGSLCHSGGSYRPIAAVRALAADTCFAAIAACRLHKMNDCPF